RPGVSLGSIITSNEGPPDRHGERSFSYNAAKCLKYSDIGPFFPGSRPLPPTRIPGRRPGAGLNRREGKLGRGWRLATSLARPCQPLRGSCAAFRPHAHTPTRHGHCAVPTGCFIMTFLDQAHCPRTTCATPGEPGRRTAHGD